MIFMKTWNDPTVNTHILPQAVSHKTITKDKFLIELSIFDFPAKRGIWKIENMDFDKNMDCLSNSFQNLLSSPFADFCFQIVYT